MCNVSSNNKDHYSDDNDDNDGPNLTNSVNNLYENEDMRDEKVSLEYDFIFYLYFVLLFLYN